MGVKISVCVRNEISGSPIDNVYVKSSLSMSNFLNCLLTKLSTRFIEYTEII
jgi:hypothetical protein